MGKVRLAGRGAAVDAVAGVDYYGTVAQALAEYEETRKGPTSAIMLSSRVIGFVETGRGPVGWVRDVAFGVLGAAGIAGRFSSKTPCPFCNDVSPSRISRLKNLRSRSSVSLPCVARVGGAHTRRREDGVVGTV